MCKRIPVTTRDAARKNGHSQSFRMCVGISTWAQKSYLSLAGSILFLNYNIVFSLMSFEEDLAASVRLPGEMKM